MANHFCFPIGNVKGENIKSTYGSVTAAIISRITEATNAEFDGKSMCLREGHFEIILYPQQSSDLEDEHRRGRVRLWFLYSNLYLEAFKSNGIWYRFNNAHPQIIPMYGVPQHVQEDRYKVVPLSFRSGYHNTGMAINVGMLRFGKGSVLELYKTLSRHPDNPEGMAVLREVLAKSCIMFPKAFRFPKLRRYLLYLMGSPTTETVMNFSFRFQSWGMYCDIIRLGRQASSRDGGPPAPADKAATGSADRDAILAKVEMERKLSMIKAWEESEKSQAENKAQKKMSSILSWENTKKAAVEAKLRTREEKLEKEKAEYAEKMRNQIAVIHKEAEEKRASVEAKRHEEIIKYEEMAAKYRSKGTTPRKILGCFG